MKRAIRLITECARPYVFGMIHVPALPGTPMNKMPMLEILNIVRKETQIYAAANVDGLIVENMHDIPYVKSPVGPEITSSMTMACQTVTDTLGKQRDAMVLGVQILAAANKEAVAVAHCTDAEHSTSPECRGGYLNAYLAYTTICDGQTDDASSSFANNGSYKQGFDLVRAECFVFSHVADEGWMDGCAGELLRYRRSIGADSVAVVTDVKKKHSSHAVTSDLSIGDVAEGAEFFLADGIVVTGRCTGQAADFNDLEEVRKSCSLPVFVGSGVSISNVHQFSTADALIVGSEFKKGGKWKNELEAERVKLFMDRINTLV